ncbi:hypothetical protein HDU98_010091 [Podochytrium sp. JEL0797]|nr:hypothetical protein HDU98_010091 [Podochytrium sp. JEL0797]
MTTRIKRISSYLSNKLGGGTPAPARTPSPSDSTLLEDAKPAPAKPNMMEKLMGAPFKLCVAGHDGSGATSIIDTVFGVPIGESLDVAAVIKVVETEQVAGPETPAVGAATAVATPAKDVPKAKKVVEFVRVARMEMALEMTEESMVAPLPSPPAGCDAVWLFVKGDFDAKLKAVADSVVEAKVPLVILLTRADLRTPQELAGVKAQIGESDAWVVVEVENPPAPVCSDCGSKAMLKRVESTGFNGWFCLNASCDLHTNAFKIIPFSKNQPHHLAPLLAATKHALLTTSSATNAIREEEEELAEVPDADITTPAPTATTTSTAPSNTVTTVTPAKKPTSASNISNRRFQIAQQIDTTSKLAYSQTFIITSTLLAAGFGANPIPFIDAPLLVATQWTLLNSICQVYGLENRSTYWSLFKYILAAPMGGLLGADLVKMIPGFGTVVGGVIDVVICATLTLSLGIAVTKMCDRGLVDRNARNFGVGEGRAFFVMDKEVGAVFKEVYQSSKDAIKAMLTSGTLSKEGLMKMVSKDLEDEAPASVVVDGEVKESVEGGEDENLEAIAEEMLLEAAKTKKAEE